MDGTETLGWLVLGGALMLVPVCFLVLLLLVRITYQAQAAQQAIWKAIAQGAVLALEQTVNRYRLYAGDTPLQPIAPVVPEHNSPISQFQQETAVMATWRARLVAAELAAKQIGGHEFDP